MFFVLFLAFFSFSTPESDIDSLCKSGDFMFECKNVPRKPFDDKSNPDSPQNLYENTCFISVKDQKPSHGYDLVFESQQRMMFRFCTFSSNKADKDGGAAYFSHTPVDFSYCYFAKNFANQNGGALFIYSSRQNTITNCYFIMNSAIQSGGAIALDSGSPANPIKDCTFMDNDANIGMSIRLFASDMVQEDEDVVIMGSTFLVRYNNGQLSNVDISNYKMVRFSDCYFLLNNIRPVSEKLPSGFHISASLNNESEIPVILDGPIFVNGGSTSVSVPDNSLVTFDYANYDINDIECKPSNNIIDTCKNKREEIRAPQTLNLQNVCFDGLIESTKNGGCVFTERVELVQISDSNFSSNSAKNGGALYIHQGFLEISNSIFSSNKADETGGAIEIMYSDKIEKLRDINIIQCTFSNNGASIKGGAIYSQIGCNLYFSNDFFYSNSAAIDGSSIYSSGITDTILNIDSCYFETDLSITTSSVYASTKELRLGKSKFIEKSFLTHFSGTHLLINPTTNLIISDCICVAGPENSFPSIDSDNLQNLYFNCKLYDEDFDFSCPPLNEIPTLTQIDQTSMIPSQSTPSISTDSSTFVRPPIILPTITSTSAPSIPEIESSKRQVYEVKSKIRIYQSIFNDILTSDQGGALYFSKCRQISITHVTFSKIRTLRSGGAVFAYQSQVEIFTSTFFECFAGQEGGAIYIMVTNYFIKDINLMSCEFNRNKASNNGGAIAIHNSVVALIDKCTFLNNEIVSVPNSNSILHSYEQMYTSYAKGNSIYTSGLCDMSLTITNSYFHSQKMEADIYFSSYKCCYMSKTYFFIDNSSQISNKVFIESKHNTILSIEECCCAMCGSLNGFKIAIFDPYHLLSLNCQDHNQCTQNSFIIPNIASYTKPASQVSNAKQNVYMSLYNNHEFLLNSQNVNNSLVASQELGTQYDAVIPCTSQALTVLVDPKISETLNNIVYLMPTTNNSLISIQTVEGIDEYAQPTVGFYVQNCNLVIEMKNTSPKISIKGSGSINFYSEQNDQSIIFDEIIVSEGKQLSLLCNKECQRIVINSIDFFRLSSLQFPDVNIYVNNIKVHKGSIATLNKIILSNELKIETNSHFNIKEEFQVSSNSTFIFEYSINDTNLNNETGPLFYSPIIKSAPGKLYIASSSFSIQSTTTKSSLLSGSINEYVHETQNNNFSQNSMRPNLLDSENSKINNPSEYDPIELVLICSDDFEDCEQYSNVIESDWPYHISTCFENSLNQTCLRVVIAESIPFQISFIKLGTPAIVGIVLFGLFIVISVVSLVFFFCESNVKKYSDITLGTAV